MEFASIEELNKWRSRFVKPDSHEVIVTEKPEIILRPLKSTRPITFAYINTGLEVDSVKEYADKMQAAGFVVSKIKKFFWSTDRSPEDYKENGQ